jgi:hypothetical protein
MKIRTIDSPQPVQARVRVFAQPRYTDGVCLVPLSSGVGDPALRLSPRPGALKFKQCAPA